MILDGCPLEKNQQEEEHSQRASELCQLVGKALA